jgi:hypothetical protein
MSRKSIPVKEQTRDRLLAYSNRHLLEDLSYDEAVNELLDWLEFPTAEEIYRDYDVIWDVVPRLETDSRTREDFAPPVRIEPVAVRDD